MPRAVATGAVALEVGAADREPVGSEARLLAAAGALGLEPDELELVAETGYYQVYSENGSGLVAAVDGRGAVALAEDARRVLAARDTLVEELLREVEAATRNLGVAHAAATGLARVRLADPRPRMQGARGEVAVAAARTLAGHTGTAVAVVTR